MEHTQQMNLIVILSALSVKLYDMHPARSFAFFCAYLDSELLAGYFQFDELYVKLRMMLSLAIVAGYVALKIRRFFTEEISMEYEDVLERRSFVKNEAKKTIVLTGAILVSFVLLISI